MELREVRVSFRKCVSDGSYGNETYEVGVTAEPDTGMSLEEAIDVLAVGTRDAVLLQLSRSGNETVREALLTPVEREARWRAERDARRQENARWEAEQRADHPIQTAMEEAQRGAEQATEQVPWQEPAPAEEEEGEA